jgi:hypothetical protein
MGAEHKPQLHIHTRDPYVRVNCDHVWLYIHADEGRVHVDITVSTR